MDFDGYLNEQLGSSEPAEPQPEAAPEQGQPRDEQGRFAAPQQQEQEKPEQDLILGKYKSVEDALKALEHSQSEIGRLRNEVGQLRQQPQEPQPQEPQYDFTGIEESDDPQVLAQAAYAALQKGDHLTYERVVRAWGEQDPFGAARFDARIAAYQSTQQLQPHIERAQQATQRAELETAVESVSQRHADFSQVVGALDEERLAGIVQDGFPVHVLQGLVGTQQEKEAVFETLYRWVKMEQTDALLRASTEAETQTAAESRQAKQQAAVASATSSPANEATGAEKELQDFYKFMLEPSPFEWASGRQAQ